MRKLYILIALVIGCQSDEEESDANNFSDPILSATQIEKPEDITQLSFEEMLQKLSSKDAIFANSPEEAPGEESNCFKPGSATSSGNASFFKFFEEVDAKDCMNKDTPDAPYTEAIIKIQSEIACLSGEVDLSQFVGKKLSELTNINTEVKKCSKVKYRTELISSIKTSGKITEGDDNVTYDAEFKSVQYVGRKDLSPCEDTVTDGIITMDQECRDISIESNQSITTTNTRLTVNVNSAEYFEFQPEGLTAKADSDAKWFSGGKLKVVANGWTGTLTYNDENKAPSYSLSKGGENKTGEISLP